MIYVLVVHVVHVVKIRKRWFNESVDIESNLVRRMLFWNNVHNLKIYQLFDNADIFPSFIVI
jgi:hypothetical protein